MPELPVHNPAWLDDYLQWFRAVRADAATNINDNDVALRAVRLCDATKAWLDAGAKPRAVPPEAFTDAQTLLQSRLVYAVIAAAYCARALRFARPDGDHWILSVFDASPARSRALLLRYATTAPVPGDACDTMARRALADRSAEVRAFAREFIDRHPASDHLPRLRDALAAAQTPDERTELTRSISSLEHGYWLDPPDASDTRPFGTSSRELGAIPLDAFEPGIPESEVVRRHVDAFDNPQTSPWRSWVDDANARWHKRLHEPRA